MSREQADVVVRVEELLQKGRTRTAEDVLREVDGAYGVRLDKVIPKEGKARTRQEQRAVEEYVKRLMEVKDEPKERLTRGEQGDEGGEPAPVGDVRVASEGDSGETVGVLRENDSEGINKLELGEKERKNNVSLPHGREDKENARAGAQGAGDSGSEGLGGNDEVGIRLESASREVEAYNGGTLAEKQEVEAKVAQKLATENGRLYSLNDVFALGKIGPSGDESDTYISDDGYVYKMNNLMHSGLLSSYLKRLGMHNRIFTNTPYELVGFVKNGGGMYPLVRQRLVDVARKASMEEISTYMSSLGFVEDGDGEFHNEEYVVKDVKPKNVFLDNSGGVYVVDAEIERNVPDVVKREDVRPFRDDELVTLVDEKGGVLRGVVIADEREDGMVEVYVERPVGGKRVIMVPRDVLTRAEVEQEEPVQEVQEEPALPRQEGPVEEVRVEPAVITQVEEPVVGAEGLRRAYDEGVRDLVGSTDGLQGKELWGAIRKNGEQARVDFVQEQARKQEEGAGLQEEREKREATALYRVPRDERGEPVYEQTDSDTAWDAIVEQTGGDVEMAKTVAVGMLEDMEAALKKAEKAKSKGVSTVAEKIAAEQERQALIEQARLRRDAWQEIVNVNGMREEAARQREQERVEAEHRRMLEEAAVLRKAEEDRLRAEGEREEHIERETLKGVPDVTEDKLQEVGLRDVAVSEEVNEFDRPFVLSSEGTTVFGEISEESGLAPAPIKLSLGENTQDANGVNHGYGLLHIEAGHGDQIRGAGFGSVQEFVETVAKNFETVKEGGVVAGNQTYLLELSDSHNNTLFVQLSRDGSYWNVNSAGIFKKKYSRRKEVVFTRPALEPETNTDFSGVDSGHTEGVTAPAGNSPKTTMGKGSEVSDSEQEKAAKSVDATRELPTEVANGGEKEGGMTIKEVERTLERMKLNAVVAPSIVANESNWQTSIETPIGQVKMGENQKEKLFKNGRAEQYGMLLETLKKPDIVLEEVDKEEDSAHERPYSYLFVKTFQKEDGAKYVHFESVTVSQNGLEVSRSSHIIRENQLKNKMKSDRLLYKATALDAPANTSVEQPISGGSLSSKGKGTEKSDAGKGKEGENVPLSVRIIKNPDMSWTDVAKEMKDKEGDVVPIEPKKKKVSPFDYVGKKGPLPGAFYKDGYVVRADGYTIYARKEVYSKDLEGKFVNKKGEVVDTERRTPNYKRLEPTRFDEPMDVDIRDLWAFTTGVEKKVHKHTEVIQDVLHHTNRLLAQKNRRLHHPSALTLAKEHKLPTEISCAQLRHTKVIRTSQERRQALYSVCSHFPLVFKHNPVLTAIHIRPLIFQFPKRYMFIKLLPSRKQNWNAKRRIVMWKSEPEEGQIPDFSWSLNFKNNNKPILAYAYYDWFLGIIQNGKCIYTNKVKRFKGLEKSAPSEFLYVTSDTFVKPEDRAL